MARKYNQFVHQLYSKEGREVPSLISRIQYRYVMDYNDYLSDYRILKVFFKPLEVPGGRVPFTDSSLYIPSIKR